MLTFPVLSIGSPLMVSIPLFADLQRLRASAGFVDSCKSGTLESTLLEFRLPGKGNGAGPAREWFNNIFMVSRIEGSAEDKGGRSGSLLDHIGDTPLLKLKTRRGAVQGLCWTTLAILRCSNWSGLPVSSAPSNSTPRRSGSIPAGRSRTGLRGTWFARGCEPERCNRARRSWTPRAGIRESLTG